MGALAPPPPPPPQPPPRMQASRQPPRRAYDDDVEQGDDDDYEEEEDEVVADYNNEPPAKGARARPAPLAAPLPGAVRGRAQGNRKVPPPVSNGQALAELARRKKAARA